MTKHFCDKCGKEVSALTMWDIHCDARNTETHFHFEVCSECMLKLNKLLDSKSESEEEKEIIDAIVARPKCMYCEFATLKATDPPCRDCYFTANRPNFKPNKSCKELYSKIKEGMNNGNTRM